MPSISIVEPNHKLASILATPIFLISLLRIESGAEVTFEVFENDGSRLKEFVGTNQLYQLGDKLFWAELKSLRPCKSTTPGLALLRHKPILRGVLLMHGEAQGNPS
jgi:hypothetical protein